MRKLLLHPVAKPVLFVLCLLPLVWLVYAAATNQLGANPAEALIRATGDWTLRALCLVLAVTPLRVITASPQLARFRRMLGLFVFFYALLHLLSYSGFDMGFDLAEIARDIPSAPLSWWGSWRFSCSPCWQPHLSNGPFGRWEGAGGRLYTGRRMGWPDWQSCIFSGCVRAKTTLRK